MNRLNNSHIYPLKKEKPITLAEKKKQFGCAPSSESKPTCTEAVDQHQQFGGRLKHFPSLGTDLLLQSREKQAQRESKCYDRFISKEKIFTNMIRNDSVSRDPLSYPRNCNNFVIESSTTVNILI